MIYIYIHTYIYIYIYIYILSLLGGVYVQDRVPAHGEEMVSMAMMMRGEEEAEEG